jgi:hypothetical protein
VRSRRLKLSLGRGALFSETRLGRGRDPPNWIFIAGLKGRVGETSSLRFSKIYLDAALLLLVLVHLSIIHTFPLSIALSFAKMKYVLVSGGVISGVGKGIIGKS